MSTVVEEVVAEVEALSDDLQRRVLKYARELRSNKPRGVPGKDLLRFAGMIAKDDLDLMSEAIEVECEQIHASEW